MKKIVLISMLGAALAVTACSEKAANETAEAGNAVAADVGNVVDAAGNTIEGATNDAMASVGNVMDRTGNTVSNASNSAGRAAERLDNASDAVMNDTGNTSEK